MTIQLDIVTAERAVFSGEVDIVVAPGKNGQLGILSHHAPFMSTLSPGELLARRAGNEYVLAIGGGFLEVRSDRVIVLADAAERAEEIDIARAEAAKRRAQQKLAHPVSPEESEAAETSLQRALARLEAAKHVKRRKQR